MTCNRVTFRHNNLSVLCVVSLEQDLRRIYAEFGWVYDWLIAQPDTIRLRGRKPVLAGHLAGTKCLVKQHTHGGILRHVTGGRFWNHRRFLNAMRAADYLEEHRVLTPSYLFVSWRAEGIWKRAESGVMYLPDGIDGAQYFFGVPNRPTDEAARKSRIVGALVRQLHDVDFHHQDMNLMNILFLSDNRAAVLDLDKSSAPIAALSLQAKESNLARMFRSVRKLGRSHSNDFIEMIIQGIRDGYRRI